MATISEKTGMSVGLVFTLVGAIVAAVMFSVTGVAKGETNARDIDAANKRMDRLEAVQAAAQKESADLALQMRDLNGSVNLANVKLDDMKETLKEMKSSGVVNARGRGN